MEDLPWTGLGGIINYNIMKKVKVHTQLKNRRCSFLAKFSHLFTLFSSMRPLDKESET